MGHPPGATARQVTVLSAIRDLIRLRGYPPTVKELSLHLGCTSKGGAACSLRALEKKGYIVHDPRTARSLTITEKGLERLLPAAAPSQVSTAA